MHRDVFHGQEHEAARARRRWLVEVVVGVVGFVMLIGLTLLLVWWLVGGQLQAPAPQAPAPLSATPEMARLHAEFMAKEGFANRGTIFETLVLTYDHWRRTSGWPVLTEAQMVQAFGPPDLMLRDESSGSASFAYFYSRAGPKDSVVYFEYTSGSLTIAWNAASVNAQAHAEMVPYAPPATTQPSTMMSE